MSKKPISIVERIEELQRENESLQALKRSFNQMVRNEFGYDVKTVHEIIKKQQRYEERLAGRKAEKQGRQPLLDVMINHRQ